MIFFIAKLVLLNTLTVKMLFSAIMFDVKNAAFPDNTHSSNSKIPEKIKKKRIFWITNLINTVVVEIMSNKSSFIKLLLDADPFIVTQKITPKSINKLTGIDKIKIVNKKNAPIPQIKIFVCKRINEIAVKINRLIVNINRIAKKK